MRSEKRVLNMPVVSATLAAGASRGRHRRSHVRSDKAWLGVGGVLLAAGVAVGGFVVWHAIVGDAIRAGELSAHAESAGRELVADILADAIEFSDAPPKVSKAPAEGAMIGVLQIPSLEISRVVAEGTTASILDSPTAGVGHFADSQMPGDFGNFALAGHRSSTFPDLTRLQAGDEIHIITAEGLYVYSARGEGYVVTPDAVEVVDAIPGVSTSTYRHAVEQGVRALTLVTCWPNWSNTHRLIVHADFKGWVPAAMTTGAGG